MADTEQKARLQEIDERLMELSSLFEITKLLSSTLNLQSVLNNILLTPMGRMMINKGLVLLEKSSNVFAVEALKGLPHEFFGRVFKIDDIPRHPVFLNEIENNVSPYIDFLKQQNLKLIIPINSSNKILGALVFGGKLSGLEYSEKEIDYLLSLSNISATAISNSIMFQQLDSVNRKLDQTNQSLNTLFEIGVELNSTLEVDKILKLLGYALMGQMLINKFAIYLRNEDRFELAESKGIKDLPDCPQDFPDINKLFRELQSAYDVDDEPDEEIRKCFTDNNINLLIPMKIQDETKGIILFGDRINKNPYSEFDKEFLNTLGNQAMISLENARLFEETIEKQKMEEELAVATEIQNNLLPKRFPEFENLELEAVNIPSKYVGGDYYDFIKISDDILVTVIADVSGKGVPASLLMANLQASIRALAQEVEDPAILTGKVNDIIYENTASDKFITFFYSRFTRSTGELEYCNAGHNHPVVITNSGEITYLDEGGLILGMLPDIIYKKGKVVLNPGDTVVMYTDGITEALNHKEEEFEETRLMEVIEREHNNSASTIESSIINAVYDFVNGYPQSDDLTLVVLRLLNEE
ncbi:SpoIIE family protein phosphatase [candidate division KSB1 bacterium]